MDKKVIERLIVVLPLIIVLVLSLFIFTPKNITGLITEDTSNDIYGNIIKLSTYNDDTFENFEKIFLNTSFYSCANTESCFSNYTNFSYSITTSQGTTEGIIQISNITNEINMTIPNKYHGYIKRN